MLAPLAWGEGAAVVVVGDSGAGKSYTLARLAESWTRRSPGIVLVAGAGCPVRAAVRVAAVADLASAPPARIYVVTGGGAYAPAEELAALAWRVARRRPVALVIDELRDAAIGSPARWRVDPSEVARAYTRGRRARVSVLAGTQSPQDCPREAFEQSELLIHRLGGRGLSYLARLGCVDDRLARVLPTLPGRWAPPASRGAYAVAARGEAWDGRLHRFVAS